MTDITEIDRLSKEVKRNLDVALANLDLPIKSLNEKPKEVHPVIDRSRPRYNGILGRHRKGKLNTGG